METINYEIRGTSLNLTEKEMVISIPRSFLSKMQWERLGQIVLQLGSSGVAWVLGPSTIAAVPATADKAAPRKKWASSWGHPAKYNGPCPLFEQCLTPKQQLKDNPQRELQTKTAAHKRAQQNRERSRTAEGWGLRLRHFAAEGLFGHLNHYHNGDKAPYRAGQMDHIAQLMVAFTSNLEQLAAHT